MGKKINSVLFTLVQAYLSEIISYRAVVDKSSKNLHWLPLERSFEVTWGRQLPFTNNFWSKRDRDVGLVSVRSSWPGESTDMQYDQFRSSCDLGLTTWGQTFDLDLSKSFHIWFDAPERDKHDSIKFVALPLKLKMLLSKNHFGKFWNFDPWGPEFWPEQKKWPQWFRNDFLRTFERCLSFSLRRPGAEIMGGRSNAPPPSRRWKIQRPSRARVDI